MKKIQILWDFIRLSVTEKVAFYQNVIAKLTDNPTYPSPPIALSDAKTAVDTLDASIIAARDGSHFAVSTMHDNEKAADAIFRALANYVESTADGDETKIINSGFHGTKQPTPIQKATLAVVDGLHSGSVKFITKAVVGGGAYIFQMTKGKPTPESVWLPVTTTLYTTYTVEGLEPACYYSFRVAAVTPDGITDFCTPVEKIVT